MTDSRLKQLRTFVFDDDPAIAGVLKKILQRRGHEVFTFSTPAQCPHHESPDCPCPSGERCADFIITDVQMPHVSGLDFVEHQKKRCCKCENYAVMSGHWNMEDMAFAHGLGCLVIEKPFEAKQLIDWLEIGEMRIDPERKLNNWFQQKLEK